MPLRARAYMGRSVTSSPLKIDAARIGRRQADGHVESRGLAGAVRAEQADDFARLHLEADAAHNRAAAVRLREVLRAERRHSALAAACRSVSLLGLRAGSLSAFDAQGYRSLWRRSERCPSLRRHPSAVVRRMRTSLSFAGHGVLGGRGDVVQLIADGDPIRLLERDIAQSPPAARHPGRSLPSVSTIVSAVRSPCGPTRRGLASYR